METEFNKVVPFWMSLLIIVTIFWILPLITNQLILIYFLFWQFYFSSLQNKSYKMLNWSCLYFSTKDKIPYFLKSFLVYKFGCARCNSCYIGETCHHFKTRIDEHVKKDKKSNIYKHLHNNEECFSSFNSDCFYILDYAPTQFQIKIKEGIYIDWEKPNLSYYSFYLVTLSSPFYFLFLFIKYDFRLASLSLFYVVNTNCP